MKKVRKELSNAITQGARTAEVLQQLNDLIDRCQEIEFLRIECVSKFGAENNTIIYVNDYLVNSFLEGAKKSTKIKEGDFEAWYVASLRLAVSEEGI